MAKRKYYIFRVDEKRRLWRLPITEWPFVLISGVALTLVALLDGGWFTALGATTAATTTSTPASGVTGCTLTVTADLLNVRSGPDPGTALVETLNRGQVVDGTRTVTTGFRQLSEGRWAAQEFLTPTAGSTCG